MLGESIGHHFVHVDTDALHVGSPDGDFNSGLREDGGVEVEEAAATVADEELAFSKLIPHLRADSHLAAAALLALGFGEASASAGVDAVETDEEFFVDEAAQGCALGVECGECGFCIGFALANTDDGFFESVGEVFNAGAGLGESGFSVVSALEAEHAFVFKALDLGLGKTDFMLDGGGLGGGGDGIELGFEAGGFLLMTQSFAIHTRSQGFFSVESVGSGGDGFMRGGEGGFSLANFFGQSLEIGAQTNALQFHCLQPNQCRDLRVHNGKSLSKTGGASLQTSVWRLQTSLRHLGGARPADELELSVVSCQF